MRHGEAEAATGPDANRRLTLAGKQEVIRSAKKIIHRAGDLQIVASPYIRAQQTARLVRDSLGVQSGIDTWAEVSPGGNCSLVSDKLAALMPQGIMLVTHQPFISRLIYYLTGKEIPMATAMVACINIEVIVQASGEVEWVEHGARDNADD
jgi:phosphohistidine phosphatase